MLKGHLMLWHSSDNRLVLTGPKWTKKTLSTPVPHPQARSVGTRQVGFMDSGCWCQIQTLPSVCLSRIKIHQSRLCISSFPLSSSDELVPTATSAFCFWLTVMEPDMIFCCCSSSVSRFNMLCIPICFSAHHSCTEWLSELPYSFSVSSNQSFFVPELLFAPFWVHSRDYCVKIPVDMQLKI